MTYDGMVRTAKIIPFETIMAQTVKNYFNFN